MYELTSKLIIYRSIGKDSILYRLSDIFRRFHGGDYNKEGLTAEILDEVMPIDLATNRLGWGVDLVLCHFARLKRMLVLVDDRVRVVHPRGSGYNRDAAREQMQRWQAGIPGYESPRHFRPLRDEIRYL